MSDIIDTSGIPRRKVTTDTSGRIVEPSSAVHPPQVIPAYTTLRPLKDEMVLRVSSTLGAAAAWPVRIMARFVEHLFGAMSALIRVLMMVMIVPTLGLYMFNFASARESMGPEQISRAAGVALARTVSGITSGVWSVITGEAPEEPEVQPTEPPKKRGHRR